MKSYLTSAVVAPAVVAALLLGTPWSAPATAAAGALERAQARRPKAQTHQAAATVLASFQNQHLCFNFNSDGTISSHYLVGFLTVRSSGGYFGLPGIFTVFVYTGTLESRGMVAFSSVGFSIFQAPVRESSAVLSTCRIRQGMMSIEQSADRDRKEGRRVPGQTLARVT